MTNTNNTQVDEMIIKNDELDADKMIVDALFDIEISNLPYNDQQAIVKAIELGSLVA